VFSVGGSESPDTALPASDWSHDLVELQSGDKDQDAAILASATANDESVILASPETSEAVHGWNVLYQLAETIGTIFSVNEFLERMTDIIFQNLPADRIFVLMRDAERNEMKPEVVRHRTPARQRTKITTSRRIINHVLRTKEGVLCTNAQTDMRFGADQKDSSIHQLGLRSVICVPILSHYEVSGVIHIDCSMAMHTYTEQQLLVATAIGKMAGMAIENARLIETRLEKERLAAVGETVAHLSHNIRNILQGMRSGADVIEMGLRRGKLDRVQGGWTIVQRNLERTIRLATNMLTFSKQRTPLIELAQLNDVVEDAVAITTRQSEDKGVTVKTDLDDLDLVPLDIDGIHQVATNILLNAIDAAPKDTGTVLVRTQYDAEATEVRLAISDNGPGIPDEERASVFEAFHSTKGQGGTGLGLAASRKIVDELEGNIEIHSSPDGTTFVVRLATSHSRLSVPPTEQGPTSEVGAQA
jgi:two-component system, NtrC family, sensor kinase